MRKQHAETQVEDILDMTECGSVRAWIFTPAAWSRASPLSPQHRSSRDGQVASGDGRRGAWDKARCVPEVGGGIGNAVDGTGLWKFLWGAHNHWKTGETE